MSTRTRARKGKKKATPRTAYRRQGRNPQHFPLTRVPTSRSTMYPVPSELDTTLRFYVNFVLTNTGQTYAAVRFYTNAAFSPDIVTPTNKPNGFTSLSGLYGSYRVIGYRYFLQIITREAFGFTALLRHTNTDPGTGSGQMVYSGEALSTTRLVPAAGSPPVIFRGSHTIAEVTGRPIENDDLLAADVSTVPSDQTFMGLFLQAATETFTASTGANCSLTIDLKVRFFNRKQVNDSSPKAVCPFVYDTNRLADVEAARKTLSHLSFDALQSSSDRN